MKRVAKPVFFLVAVFIIVFTALSFTGISSMYGDRRIVYIKGTNDIRWGIDIRGGVDVTFTPEEGVEATAAQIETAAEVMKQRMVSLNITDYEAYADTKNGRIIIRFPWKEGSDSFDPEAAIRELGDTALLTFRKGSDVDEEGHPIGEIVLEGQDVREARALYGQVSQNGGNVHYVSLEMNASGTQAFADATTELHGTGGTISIWMDDEMISNARVNAAITDGHAIIEGNFTSESASTLANKINDGALPFRLETATYSTITPTLGTGALEAMLLSGIIAFVLVCAYMIVMYRLPGFVACIALVGHVGGMIAAISGYLPGINSFTLTIPGIAGIILSIGMGVDANVITAERIKEELRGGKPLDASVDTGFQRGFTAIFDGNVTVIIVAIILMGAFGAPGSLFAKMLSWVFFMFGPATQGAIYSFGYTLLVGVVLNFLFSVLAARLMIKSLSGFKGLRSPWLYGGAK